MKAYPSLKPGIWGAVIGAAAISVVGFSSFKWTLGGTAERMAQERAQNRSRRRAGADVRREISAPGRCIGEIGRAPKGFLMGPAIDHREGQLGNDAGQRWSEPGGCYRLRGTACRPPVGGLARRVERL